MWIRRWGGHVDSTQYFKYYYKIRQRGYGGGAGVGKTLFHKMWRKIIFILTPPQSESHIMVRCSLLFLQAVCALSIRLQFLKENIELVISLLGIVSTRAVGRLRGYNQRNTTGEGGSQLNINTISSRPRLTTRGLIIAELERRNLQGEKYTIITGGKANLNRTNLYKSATCPYMSIQLNFIFVFVTYKIIEVGSKVKRLQLQRNLRAHNKMLPPYIHERD